MKTKSVKKTPSFLGKVQLIPKMSGKEIKKYHGKKRSMDKVG